MLTILVQKSGPKSRSARSLRSATSVGRSRGAADAASDRRGNAPAPPRGHPHSNRGRACTPPVLDGVDVDVTGPEWGPAS
jgi:hypothetical protein